MALLGVFVNAGDACLGTGLACIAHGISGFATPDTALYQIRSYGSNAASIPVFLESLGTTTVVWRNGNGAGIGGQHLVALWHGIVR